MKKIQMIGWLMVVCLLLSGPAFAHGGHHDEGMLMGVIHIFSSVDHMVYLAGIVGLGIVFIARRPILRVLRSLKLVRSN